MGIDGNGWGQSYVCIIHTIVFAWVKDFHVFSKNAGSKKGRLQISYSGICNGLTLDHRLQGLQYSNFPYKIVMIERFE